MQNIQFYKGVIDGSGCVSNGWNLIKNNYGMYLGIALISIILGGCIPCISLFLSGPIIGGVFYVLLRDMRGEPVEFGMMFKGFEKFVPLMVIGLVISIPEIIGQILRLTVDLGRIGLTSGSRDHSGNFYQGSDAAPLLAGGLLILVAIIALIFFIFSVIWRLLLFFALPLAIEHNLGPVEAMRLSARAATANVGGLVVLFIFEIGIALLGLIMICLGLFLFSIPLIYAANAFAYRQVFPLLGQPPQPVSPNNPYGGFAQGM